MKKNLLNGGTFCRMLGEQLKIVGKSLLLNRFQMVTMFSHKKSSFFKNEKEQKVSLHNKEYKKGEEKPEEVLMGNDKTSPYRTVPLIPLL